MSLPSQLNPMPYVDASQAVSNDIIEILPVNATGNSIFNQGNNRIILNIPAFSNGFLNPRKTWLQFKAKVTGTDTNRRFNDGMPVFERMVIRAGNGLVVEDIQDVHILSRILSNLDPLTYHETMAGYRGDYRGKSVAGEGISTHVYDEQAAGVVVQYDLPSGIFGSKNSTFIPVGLFESSGGMSFSIELYLAKKEMACKSEKLSATGVPTADVDFEITDVKLMTEVVHMEEEVMRAFSSMVLEGGAVSIPFKSYRLHKSHITAQQNRVIANISESAHNVEKVYSVLMQQAKAQKAGRTDVVDDVSDAIGFFGGIDAKTNPAQPRVIVDKWQYRYGTKYYPPARVENNGTIDTNATFLTTMAMNDMFNTAPLIARRLSNGKKMWENNFVICQNFKTFSDKRALNGLNTSSTSSPMVLELEFNSSALPSVPFELVSFVESVQSINIKQGGYASLIET